MISHLPEPSVNSLNNDDDNALVSPFKPNHNVLVDTKKVLSQQNFAIYFGGHLG